MDKEKYKEILEELREEKKKELEKLEEELIQNSEREKSGDLSGYTLHSADMASDTYQQERNVHIIEHKSYILSEIEAALDRLKEGRFGICESCNKVIEEARLEVIPYTRFCIECKKREEE